MAIPPSADAASASGQVGPNAIIRVAEALHEHAGPEAQVNILRSAGLERYLTKMPEHMLDEREVTQLQSAVRAALDDYVARRVLVDAGRRTGDYLLARRIPQAVQHILRCLPPALASRMLLAAIRRNAWTFSGSGHLSARYGPPVELSLKGCPLCHGVAADAPICDYYTATFERLFRELVSPRSVAREIACHARGANACVFEIVW